MSLKVEHAWKYYFFQKMEANVRRIKQGMQYDNT